MFLHLLTESEKRAFAGAAELVIASDEVLHELEEELRASLSEELGIPWPDVTPAWEAVRGALGDASSPVSSRVILLELCGVACADLDLHENEVAQLNEIAQALGQPPEVLKACLDLAPRAHKIRAEAETLILASGGSAGAAAARPAVNS